MTGASSRLVVTAAQIAQLERLAGAAYPEECCALLVGRRLPGAAPAHAVTRLVPAANVHPAPRRAFELDPALLFATIRGLREDARGRDGGEGGELLVGHAHSHPDAPARPSERDRQSAAEAGQIWVIVPVHDGEPGRPEAWRAVADGKGEMSFEPVLLEVRADAGTGAETA